MTHFIHRPYQTNLTIAAIATPPGDGGVAIIRISGTDALSVAEKVYSGPVRSYKTHHAHCGKIINNQGHVIDEVLLLVMLAPRSYTGEDTVEIHCHGGHVITRKVLDTVLNAGALPAQPGEFTFKAFMNHKLDLSQAEAVQELIASKNELALHVASQQLQGRLSLQIRDFQHELTDIAAILEAWVDFPEEDIEFASMSDVIVHLTTTQQQIQQLHDTFYNGSIIQNGISLCLAGPPNVGKSSLMNALLGKERAIVTEIAGTTRDLIEDQLYLGNLHFRLIDTAGIRHTEELIEKEGIRRSKEQMQEADFILLVLDASQPLCSQSRELLHLAPSHKTLLVWNKVDLNPNDRQHEVNLPHQIKVSAKHHVGLHQLEEKINQIIWHQGPPSKDQVMITQLRHQKALHIAITSLQTLIDGLQTGISPEFLSSDMRHTLNALGTIIGTNISEDILNTIFSKFCIGK